MVRYDMSGQTFGRLTVLDQANSLQGTIVWLCRCQCGKTVWVRRHNLIIGKTKSCGCWNIDSHSIHGHAKNGIRTPTYRTWEAMHRRCYDPKNKSYTSYGGRGITVCKRWRTFVNFLHDMGERPANKTLDRINNDGSYLPENCRWATRAEQVKNVSYNLVVSYKGQRYICADLARKFGLPHRTFTQRIRYGWPVEKAVTTPIRPHRPYNR